MIFKKKMKLMVLDAEKEIAELIASKAKLKVELAELKHRHKLETEDIEHLVRLKQEKLDIQYEKKVIELERQNHENLNAEIIKNNQLMTSRLENETKNIKEMYAEVLDRLPNVTAHFGSPKNSGE